MKHEKLKIIDLIEYDNNAKIHTDEQIKQIMNSIQEFGFNDPIAVDEDNVIIEGHGRLYALQKLGYEEVECIRLTHLTEDQKKAYILAHNKLTMNTSFDLPMLNTELTAIKIDMSKFGFEIPKIAEPREIETDHHRDTTINQYNLYEYDEERATGFYNMPVIKGVDYIPNDLQGFNYVLNKGDKNAGVHFFLDDYQFERIWQRPEFYIEKLEDFDCVLTPDFSLYIDMPIAMQIWNIYRSRLIGQMMQDNGLIVIPTVSWSFKDSYEFCFDGLPKNSTLAISTIGIKRNEEQYEIWKNGLDELIKRTTPKNIIVYGGKVEYDYKEINVVYFENKTTERMSKIGKEET